MTLPNYQGLTWQLFNNSSTPPTLIQLIPVTFDIVNNVTFNVVPMGNYSTQVGIIAADGVVIDNIQGYCLIQVSAGGNVVQVVPAFTKSTLKLGAGITNVTFTAISQNKNIITATNTGITNITFYYGAYPGAVLQEDQLGIGSFTFASIPPNNVIFSTFFAVTGGTTIVPAVAGQHYYIEAIEIEVSFIPALNSGYTELQIAVQQTPFPFLNVFYCVFNGIATAGPQLVIPNQTRSYAECRVNVPTGKGLQVNVAATNVGGSTVDGHNSIGIINFWGQLLYSS